MQALKAGLLVGLALAVVVVLATPGECLAQAAPAGRAGAAAPSEPFSIDAVVQDLTQKFKAGGFTMWVLLFLSVLSMAFMLERLFRLRRRSITPAGLAARADALWKEGNIEEIEALCRRYRRSTLAKLTMFVVEKRNHPIDEVNTATGDIAARDIAGHNMLTYPLAAIATLSPLLGLFGTVLGMIESFEIVAVAGSMGDPSLLASGISKALVTTAFGLFIAIPTLFFYHLFRLRTTYLAKLLEEEASTLITDWLMKVEPKA